MLLIITKSSIDGNIYNIHCPKRFIYIETEMSFISVYQP